VGNEFVPACAGECLRFSGISPCCAVEIGRVRKEMEVENAKLQRDIQLLNQSMIQQEREAQVALKTEQQSHEEDIEKGAREKVVQRGGETKPVLFDWLHFLQFYPMVLPVLRHCYAFIRFLGPLLHAWSCLNHEFSWINAFFNFSELLQRITAFGKLNIKLTQLSLSYENITTFSSSALLTDLLSDLIGFVCI